MKSVKNKILISNSIYQFAIAYLVFWAITTTIQLIFSSSLSIPSRVFFDRIDFMINPDDWSGDAIKILFSIPVIAPFIYSLLCLIISYLAIPYHSTKKLFFIWGFYIGWTYCFGGIITGLLTGWGFNHAADWLYLYDTQKLLLSLLSGGCLYAGSHLIAIPVYNSASAYADTITETEFPRFVFFSFTAPAIVGILFIELLYYPFYTPALFIPLFLILAIIRLSLKNHGYIDMTFIEKPEPGYPGIWPFLSLAIIILLTRIAMVIGIRFGNYTFN